MRHRLTVILFCLLTLALCVSAQTTKRDTKKMAAIPAFDKTYLQQIWDGWSTLDPANTAKFYASGPNTYFDIAPLKYSSWDEI